MILLDKPDNWTGLLVLADSNHKYDRDLAEVEGGTPVLSKWAFGRQALGPSAWRRTARAALYQYGTNTEALTPAQEARVKAAKAPVKLRRKLIAENRAARREALADLVRSMKPTLTVVLASRATELKMRDEEVGELANHSGTSSWGIFEAPDSLSEMAGTIYQSHLGPVMGLLNPANHEFVWGATIRNSLVGAMAFAEGRAQLLAPPPTSAYMPGPQLSLYLRRILELHRAGGILSVDIETVPAEDLITCIGLACGDYAISVPWDPFSIAGKRLFEPGGSPASLKLVRELLALPSPKVGHNILGFDVPFMKARGIPMAGRIEDTIVASAVVYKQYKKGLQHAVAREFLVRSWKSEHATPGFAKNTKQAWTADPVRLRRYNLEDAYYTLKLWEALKWKANL